jgi:nitrogen regulatory protein P-II 1
VHKIEATVPRVVRDEVRDALVGCGVTGVMMTDLQGAPHPGYESASDRGVPYVPQSRVEAVVADADVRAIVDAVVAAARLAGSLEGSVLVLPIKELVPIAPQTPGSDGTRPITPRPGWRRAAGRSSARGAVRRA